MDKILVIGGGSWGTAFANYLTIKYKEIRIWVREKEIVDTIKLKRENTAFLPGIKVSETLIPAVNLKLEAENADIIIFAVPSKFIKSIFTELKGIVEKKIFVNLSKGFEAKSLKTVSQLAVEVYGPDIINNWITISGPSFARELAQKHPTAVVAGSKNEDISQKIQRNFSSDILRIYRTDDLIGIEIGGSIKNTIAIASGIIKGSGFDFNTTASLVTRASMEISRFGVKFGARQETFWGLAGIGDLMLTCFGPLSRNFQLGIRIAKGETLEEIERTSKMIAEGVETTRAIRTLSKKLKIDMPISSKVYDVLFRKKKPKRAMKELMKRSLKPEWNSN